MLPAIQPSVVPKILYTKNLNSQNNISRQVISPNISFQNNRTAYLTVGGLAPMAFYILYMMYHGMHGLYQAGMTLNWPN